MYRVYLLNQIRGGTTFRSNVYRLLVAREQAPSAQYPLTILSGLIAVLPPYKNTLRSQKCVPCGHYQKLLRDAGVTTAPNSLANRIGLLYPCYTLAFTKQLFVCIVR